jgi:hypothetical protein
MEPQRTLKIRNFPFSEKKLFSSLGFLSEIVRPLIPIPDRVHLYRAGLKIEQSSIAMLGHYISTFASARPKKLNFILHSEPRKNDHT